MTENKLLRSFARRIGKSLSAEQQKLLTEELPKLLFNADLFSQKTSAYFLEIGCGMGENIINQALNNKEAIYIGSEPYLNGIGNCLKLMQANQLSNIRLWPDDVDLILSQIPATSLDGAFILFPDPWHKRRHNKRRILNSTRLGLIKNTLKHGAIIWFASDITDYYNQVVKLFTADNNFEIVSNSDKIFPPHYTKTKYNQKADEEGRVSHFLQLRYIG